MSNPRRCLYCRSSFVPSRFRPEQRVCGRPNCQHRRRADSRRQKLATDTEYDQVVRESRKKWRDEHPDYQKQYWEQHPEARERNRQQQHLRDQRRRLQRLVKNNLALDLKHSVSEVWLVGPRVHRLEKNNLASAQVLIVPSVTDSRAESGPS